jgi:hypothetical protein
MKRTIIAVVALATTPIMGETIDFAAERKATVSCSRVHPQ